LEEKSAQLMAVMDFSIIDFDQTDALKPAAGTAIHEGSIPFRFARQQG
jgi:hypothetical protein